MSAFAHVRILAKNRKIISQAPYHAMQKIDQLQLKCCIIVKSTQFYLVPVPPYRAKLRRNF